MNPARRTYSLNDSSLIQLSDKLVIAGTEDQVQLADHGVTPATFLLINNTRNEFSDYPTDEEMSGLVMEATLERNNLQKLLIQKVHVIISKARIKYGDNHPKYIRYGVGSISQCSVAEVVRRGNRVVRVATDQLLLLADEGMTEALIQELKDLVAGLDKAIDDQIDAEMNRHEAMHERVTKGNQLYALLVNLAAKGKICWLDVNESKYNHYIIYPTTTAGGQTLNSTISAQGLVSHSLADVVPDSPIKVINTGTTDIQIFFSNESTNTTGNPFMTVLAGGVSINTALQLGFNEVNGFVYFNVFNTGATQGSYEVHWP